jgi:1,4-dihydroxy-2-naphthoate octaprenyltransferase
LEEIAGPGAKPLKLGLGGFLVGLVGAAVSLSIDHGPTPGPLVYFGFGMVVLGVAVGFLSVAWGWHTALRRRRTKEK